MIRMFVFVVSISAIGASVALGQAPPSPWLSSFVLRPASEPRPALKYRLVPDRNSLIPGNAAVFYHRAILMLLEKRLNAPPQKPGKSGEKPESIDEQISQWINGPIAEIPRDQARATLESHKQILKEVELGAMRSTCDWELDRPDESYYLLIPEIQKSRSLARLVNLKARLAILDGKPDEAFHWIATGMVLGRHVSQGPTMIQSLVGVAINREMLVCLKELIQAPGSPSLYWALADRPRPFVDFRASMEGERNILEKEIPGLTELDKGPWSLDKAQKFSDELQRKLFALVGGEPMPGVGFGMSGFFGMSGQLTMAAMTAKIYPEARKALIAQGKPEAEVDVMPVVQVATLYCHQEYRARLDETFKWVNLPYWKSHDRLDRSSFYTVDAKLANPLLTLFWSLTPAVKSILLAQVLLERQIDAIQCVEAIQLYASSHDGKVPPSLDALTDHPVPLDPGTGKSFEYKLDGDSAILSAPVPPGAPSNHPSYQIRFVLKPAR